MSKENTETSGEIIAAAVTNQHMEKVAQKREDMLVNGAGIQITSMNELQRFCKMAVAAKVFKSTTDLAKACMIAQYGMEMGVSPATALQNMHMIEGRVCIGAGLMAGLVKRTGKYSYKMTEHTREGCTLVFIEKDVGELGVSCFDREDAMAATLLNKHNWKKWPKAMFYSRALSMGARMFCADMFLGAAVHTPEEISGGEYVDHAFAEAWGMDSPEQNTKEVFSVAEDLKEELKRKVAK